LPQVVLVAGFVLLGVTAWYAKKAVTKIEEEELERELAEQQQQQGEGQQAGADVELGAAAAATVAAAGCKDVDVVPLSPDQQQALKLQDSTPALQGLPNSVKGSDSGADLQVLLRQPQP
jgi:type II secretory pathway component PulM